jgi:PIN domain nuclease of toxin-antitoxin system
MKAMAVGELKTHFSKILEEVKQGQKVGILYGRVKKPENQILVSAVSLWEIALKHSLGKLTVNFDIQKIPEYCEKMGFELVPINPAEALQSSCLPQKTNHKDPFDRMLVYQCITNGYTLANGDNRIEQYKKDGLKFIR